MYAVIPITMYTDIQLTIVEFRFRLTFVVRTKEGNFSIIYSILIFVFPPVVYYHIVSRQAQTRCKSCDAVVTTDTMVY